MYPEKKVVMEERKILFIYNTNHSENSRRELMVEQGNRNISEINGSTMLPLGNPVNSELCKEILQPRKNGTD